MEILFKPTNRLLQQNFYLLFRFRMIWMYFIQIITEFKFSVELNQYEILFTHNLKKSNFNQIQTSTRIFSKIIFLNIIFTWIK